MFTLKFLKDMGERVVWTFVQAFLAVWVVTGDFTQQTLKVAAAAGLVAAGKAVLASRMGDSESAATLPGA